MKPIVFIITIISTIFLLPTSCQVRVKTRPIDLEISSEGNHNIPPGQMKKINGNKSAREYAPGHNKY